jgi:hypothetical protein
MFGWCFVHSLGKILATEGFEQQSRTWIDEWLLGKIMAGVLQDGGLDEASAWRAVAMVKLLTEHQLWFKESKYEPADKGERKPAQATEQARQVLASLLQDSEVQQFMQVNRWQGVLWFNKEAFERLLEWLLVLATVDAQRHELADQVARRIAERYGIVRELLQAEEASGYQVEKLLEM